MSMAVVCMKEGMGVVDETERLEPVLRSIVIGVHWGTLTCMIPLGVGTEIPQRLSATFRPTLSRFNTISETSQLDSRRSLDHT